MALNNEDKLFLDAMLVAGNVAATAIRATPNSNTGILGILIAAGVLAETAEWPREKFEEAFAAVIGDVYKDRTAKPLTLNA